MITAEQADYLITLPKKIIENEQVLERKNLSPKQPFIDRFYLISEEDTEFSLFLDITQSKKKAIKFTLHYQEDGADYGLLRVDYSGRHKNPETANEHVPESFKPYTGLWLDDYPGHIHYVVDGYAPLKWAIPLEIDDFPVKQINTFADITNSFSSFCKRINIQTDLIISTQSNAFL